MLQVANDGSMSAQQRGIRGLRDVCLSYLVSLDTHGAHELARQQLQSAKNMTDRNSALAAMANSTASDRDALLDDFYQEWQREAFVVDRWFRVQAMARHPRVLDHVTKLAGHPAFESTNPNRVFSLLVAFASGNPSGFHRQDSAGYRFIAEWVCRIDPVNPQVAARLVSSLTSWKDMIPTLGNGMVSALREIRGQASLSPDVAEMVSRALEED